MSHTTLDIPTATHQHYLRHALSLARQSPPKATNYSVGAVLVQFPLTTSNDTTSSHSHAGTILSTGYTLELPGNTHAEQCCFLKLASAHSIPDSKIALLLSRLIYIPSYVPQKTSQLVLYTTMEPCSRRLSGALPCVDRIIAAKHISMVVCGVTEPDTFVERNEGRARLEEVGVRVVKVEGMEEEILEVARAGHAKESDS